MVRNTKAPPKVAPSSGCLSNRWSFRVLDYVERLYLFYSLGLSNLCLYLIIGLFLWLLLQRYEVWGDWENPYLTLNPDYEAAQVTVDTTCFVFGRPLRMFFGFARFEEALWQCDHCYIHRDRFENVFEWPHLQRPEACSLEPIIWNCACWSRAWGASQVELFFSRFPSET